ncbi:MAG: LysR family transcriptional regulator [Oculatellaceae cyanobacterium bins.114]|nr:LysR family transcriptional regulator [Oculatellaceae cyanobacterium bins.114]
MNIELRHLHYFIAVAEELNFGRAAERLHIAQPPLTRQIHQLEKELGVELFHRTTRRIELTEAGQVYLPEARRVLAQVQEGATLAQLASRGEVGRLMVGFEGSSAYDIVPLAVKAFREKFPRVSLIVREMTTGDQVRALHEGHLGLGFVVPPLSDTRDLMVETVLREPLIVAMPHDHPQSHQSAVDLADLKDETFIVCPRHHKCGLYDHLISICRQRGFSPRLTQETHEVQSILGFVAAGLGVALLPASVKHLQRSQVVYRTLQPQTEDLELAIAWRRENPSPMMPVFLEIVREYAHQITHETASN